MEAGQNLGLTSAVGFQAYAACYSVVHFALLAASRHFLCARRYKIVIGHYCHVAFAEELSVSSV